MYGKLWEAGDHEYKDQFPCACVEQFLNTWGVEPTTDHALLILRNNKDASFKMSFLKNETGVSILDSLRHFAYNHQSISESCLRARTIFSKESIQLLL